LFISEIPFLSLKVVDFYDGDTLIISDDGRARIIRLFGVDCPEKNNLLV